LDFLISVPAVVVANLGSPHSDCQEIQEPI